MTRKASEKVVKREDGWKGYVNWNPTPAEKKEIEHWMGNGSFDAQEYILQLDESGYSSTFAYDEKANCHRLTLTGKGERCPNKGYSISFRASHPTRCVALAAYYNYVLCESGDWFVEKEGQDVW